jgi:hypothetical protein
MKKLILTVGICLSTLVLIQAQQIDKAAPPTKEQRVEKMMTNLNSTCNLTPAQTTKAKPIVTEFVNSVAANKQQYGSDKDKLREANQASMKTMNTKLSAILNADQQKQLTSMEEQKIAARQKSTTTSN